MPLLLIRIELSKPSLPSLHTNSDFPTRFIRRPPDFQSDIAVDWAHYLYLHSLIAGTLVGFQQSDLNSTSQSGCWSPQQDLKDL